jgi:orotate phosphoribosyltransferase
MDMSKLARRIRAATLLSGEFTLRSGKVSSFYWDKYRFESDPVLLLAIVDEMEKLLPTQYDKLAGMELGGVPLATGLSLKIDKPCLFVRKKAKEYGTCNLIEGGFQSGEAIVVIEDIITTAGQVCQSVPQMREQGLLVNDVICVIDRQQGGAENLAKIDCMLASVLTQASLDAMTDSDD